MINLSGIIGFDRDSGNARKSAKKHDVSQSEAEQLFFNVPLLLLSDSKHSQKEARYHALGKTDVYAGPKAWLFAAVPPWASDASTFPVA